MVRTEVKEEKTKSTWKTRKQSHLTCFCNPRQTLAYLRATSWPSIKKTSHGCHLAISPETVFIRENTDTKLDLHNMKCLQKYVFVAAFCFVNSFSPLKLEIRSTWGGMNERLVRVFGSVLLSSETAFLCAVEFKTVGKNSQRRIFFFYNKENKHGPCDYGRANGAFF